ncbi:MAG: hypothetical protein RLZ97_2548 [Verrucomicrobiota bacterium]
MSGQRPPLYPEGEGEAIPVLGARLREEIATGGPVSFPRFMAEALYAADGGYYSAPGRMIGRAGDFFTSVSAGPVFGELLARHMAAVAPAGDFRIVELGAHHGTLARDVLETLERDFPETAARARYTLVEPLAALRAVQKETLKPWQVDFHERIDEMAAGDGILIANELIDALPCHVLESDGAGWQEIGVGLSAVGDFQWQALGPAGALAEGLPTREAGYRTEVRPGLEDFLEPLSKRVSRMLFIDYGFEREELLDPARSDGTLRTYRNHQAGDDPLVDPGKCDITAHVDFTALREAVERLGGDVMRFENQSRFLTALARPCLLEREGRTDESTRKWVRNFQTLTHPAQLGARFHVMEAVFQGRSI